MNVLLILLLSCFISAVYGGLQACCPAATSRECIESCKKLVSPSTSNYTDFFSFQYMNAGLAEVVEKCPRSEAPFWNCLEGTGLWKDFRQTKSRDKKRRSKHNACCKEAKHMSCEVECYTTNSVSKLLKNENCNANREPTLRQCVIKVHAAKQCCHSRNRDCKHACMQYFKNTKSEEVLNKKAMLQTKCGKESKQYKCAIRQSKFHNAFEVFAVCCEKGVKKSCVNSCKKSLRNAEDFKSFFNKMETHCGPVNFQVPIYKCLLVQYADGRTKDDEKLMKVVDRSGKTIVHRTFKQQCCNRAKSPECRVWCEGAISRPSVMGLWDVMYLSCIENPKEVELSNCMTDILEPCEIGVKEPMSFCTNFNDRPLELFRLANKYGDSSARKMHKFWNVSNIQISKYQLSFKNVYECKPEMFKALACLLAVKPCDHHSSQRQVCRSDCEDLLDSCLDKEASTEHYSVKDICAAILPKTNQTNCISVKDYTEKKPEHELMNKNEVTLPCEKNPCNSDEMCMINQDCNPNSVLACKKYKCVKGCPASGKSKLLIPMEQLAKLSATGSDEDCYTVCKCQPMGSHVVYFGECKKFGCNNRKNCTVQKNTYSDGAVFENDCNTCMCIDGSIECTEKYCDYSQNGRPRRHHSTSPVDTITSPCNCHNVYKPVCASNGMTYPNQCIAKCSNVNDNLLSLGDCLSVDPCNPDPCDNQLQCVPTRNVCLPPWNDCPQYTCVSSNASPRYFSDVYRVCMSVQNGLDTDVCGFDGFTYKSKCQAEDVGTGIDYHGDCLPSKYQNGKGDTNRCDVIKCPDIDDTNCKLVTPPGACCPVCGSFTYLSYKKKSKTRHDNFADYKPVQVVSIVKHMRQLLKTHECKLYGHLSERNELLVIITVDNVKPTSKQEETCRLQAERIRECFNNGKPLESEVCGFDGVTYKCKCQAEDAGTGVDYDGPCLPEKFHDNPGNIERCQVVKCPEVDSSICNLVTPPGSCCPVCGSLIRSLYSKEDVIRHQKYIDSKPITVSDIVQYLRQLLKVAECRLYGHLTVERDLLLIITVDSLKPTRSQIHACKTEAERYNKYINNRSPILLTNYYLSLLKVSKLQAASYKSTKSSTTSTFPRTESYTVMILMTFVSLLYINLTR